MDVPNFAWQLRCASLPAGYARLCVILIILRGLIISKLEVNYDRTSELFSVY